MSVSEPHQRFPMRLRLRTKLLIGILLLEGLLLLGVFLVVESEMRQSLLDQFIDYAATVTKSLVAANSDYIMTYNYIKIDQHLGKTIEEHNLMYAAVVLFDGDVASYQEKMPVAHRVLEGPLHQQALQTDTLLIQYDQIDDRHFCDIALPVMHSGEMWGVVRIGVDLDNLQKTIFKTRKSLFMLGIFSLVLGWVVSILLARRITQPVHYLVERLQAVSDGHYDEPIAIHSSDEIGYLAYRFGLMQQALQRQFRQLMESNALLQQEIEASRRKEQTIQHLSLYDTVTNLPNREQLTHYINACLQKAKDRPRLVALLLLDLDNFQRINDTVGHHQGDQLLRAVSVRLKECLRSDDYLIHDHAHRELSVLSSSWNTNTLARTGGDEFVIVLDDMAEPDDAAVVAQRIRRHLAEPFLISEVPTVVTISIGISIFPMDGKDLESLFKYADTALYHAKKQGKDTYQFYTEAMNQHVQERFALEAQLRESVKAQSFELFYQPKTQIGDQAVTGAEALLRWKRPGQGYVSPAQFIPIAEESGLIVPLGEWVLYQACHQCHRWHQAGYPDLRISVNISALQLKRGNLPETVRCVLAETALPASFLELELTESLLMEDLDHNIAQLKALKDLGVGLAIDDFGTGYSSLSYLKKFPIDTLKIDQSFVRDIAVDRDDASIVAAIIALGQSLQLRLVAEGVEDAAQWTFLENLGCHEVQGFLFSRPLAPDAFERFLQEASSRHSEITPDVHPKRVTHQPTELLTGTG